VQATPTDLEQIEFLVAGHAAPLRGAGEGASGGELSRRSLAIQTVTSQVAAVPTLISDEVDAGIGGLVAEIVGRMLKNSAAVTRLLCVTHLPQVRRPATAVQVSKSAASGKVASQVAVLGPYLPGRGNFARMLGGVEDYRDHAQARRGNAGIRCSLAQSGRAAWMKTHCAGLPMRSSRAAGCRIGSRSYAFLIDWHIRFLLALGWLALVAVLLGVLSPAEGFFSPLAEGRRRALSHVHDFERSAGRNRVHATPQRRPQQARKNPPPATVHEQHRLLAPARPAPAESGCASRSEKRSCGCRSRQPAARLGPQATAQ